MPRIQLPVVILKGYRDEEGARWRPSGGEEREGEEKGEMGKGEGRRGLAFPSAGN
jgi:hypothetical protein